MNSSRILLASSLLFLLLSILTGVIYSSYYQSILEQKTFANLDLALNMAIKGDIIMSSQFAMLYAKDLNKLLILNSLPNHLMVLGIAMLVPLFILPKLNINKLISLCLALNMLIGSLLIISSDFHQFLLGIKNNYLILGGYLLIGFTLFYYALISALQLWLKQAAQKRLQKRNMRLNTGIFVYGKRSEKN